MPSDDSKDGSDKIPFKARVKRLLGKLRGKPSTEFTTSDEYWEQRYVSRGNSGAGSYGRLAQYKSEVLNEFVKDNGISSVIEFGSGDGNQLSLAEYGSYIGVDVSQTAVLACRKAFGGDASKTFLTVSEYDGETAELSLSLDVIYHLIEDDVFNGYMETLFDAASRFVVIYASNKDEHPKAQHVKHRKFTDWVEAHRPDFALSAHIPNKFPFDVTDPNNTSFADFYIYSKTADS